MAAKLLAAWTITCVSSRDYYQRSRLSTFSNNMSQDPNSVGYWIAVCIGLLRIHPSVAESMAQESLTIPMFGLIIVFMTLK